MQNKSQSIRLGFRDKKDEDGEEESHPVERTVFARLNRKQYFQVTSGSHEMVVPEGVSMCNRAGNRGLYFTCDDKKSFKLITDALDADMIEWSDIT